MSAHAVRAELLLAQRRYDQAEQEWRLALALDPNNGYLHAQLALALSYRDHHETALEEAHQAVGLAPDDPVSHATLGIVLVNAGRLRDAETATEEAVRLDPSQADTWALLARIRAGRERWSEALEASSQALTLDPENVSANNIRAVALRQMGRRAEAGQTIATALARDPDNAETHANQGWSLLHANQPREAMVHFREALRLSPEDEWARQGILEALKAHNPLYRLLLMWFLGMSRLSPRARWGVILGLYVLFQVTNAIEHSNPGLAPFTTPLIAFYLAFVILTWIAYPLFNLALRLHPFGRHALSQDQRSCSNWVGGLLLLATAGVTAHFTILPWLGLIVAMDSAVMVIPVAAIYGTRRRDARSALTLLTLGLASLGVLSLTMVLFHTPGAFPVGIGFMLLCQLGPSFVRSRHQ
jgi:tetratricopeptide (TPR) repeat protein